MVSKIINGKSLIGALNYNEKKVSQGKAELIWENGFPKDIYLLSFKEKLSRLTDLASKNKITKTNTVHISLNFAEGEKLERDIVNQISSDYMERIGFGNQPYLVYMHSDAGHPHVHIVSTNIKSTGERICLNNLGKTKSEIARKSIERDYGLVQASGRSASKKEAMHTLGKVEYGKMDTKRAITNVVHNVITSYRFTSLPEFNAVLNQFNVLADRGAKESRMYAKNGLLYWVLDKNGHKTGVPIKASSIYGNPTLKKIQSRFEHNELLKKPLKDHIKNSIDRVLVSRISRAGFKQALEAKGIQVIFWANDNGRLYGVTFVDHQSKVVFNGSDIGKAYSVSALLEKFDNQIKSQTNYPTPSTSVNATHNFKRHDLMIDDTSQDGKSMLEGLFKPDFQDTAIPGMLQNKRKKKRKRLTS